MTATFTAEDVVVKQVHLDRISAWEKNPRSRFDEAKLQELADSIKLHGVQQPIVVRSIFGDDGKINTLSIVMGERRWRASKLAGRHTIPCIIRRDLSDLDALQLALAENIDRSDLSAVEEAHGFVEMLHLDTALRQKDVAERVGRSEEYVSNRIRLLTLPYSVIDLMDGGLLTPGHARALLRFVKFTAVVERIAALAAENGSSVRSLERGLPFYNALVQEGLVRPLYMAMFDLRVCLECPIAARFDGGDGSYGAACLAPVEFEVRQAAHKREALASVEARIRAAEAAGGAENEKFAARMRDKMPELQGGDNVAAQSPIPGEAKGDAQAAAGDGIVELSLLDYRAYADIYDREDLPGCSEECPCRAMGSRGPGGAAHAVCLDPARRQGLMAARSRIRNDETRAHLNGRMAALVDCEDVSDAFYQRAFALCLADSIGMLDAGAREWMVDRIGAGLSQAEFAAAVKDCSPHNYSSQGPLRDAIAAMPRMQVIARLAAMARCAQELRFGLHTVNRCSDLTDFLLEGASDWAPDPPPVVEQAVDEAQGAADADGMCCMQCAMPICKDWLGEPIFMRAEGTVVLRNGVTVVGGENTENGEFDAEGTVYFCAECSRRLRTCVTCGNARWPSGAAAAWTAGECVTCRARSGQAGL